MVQPSIEVRERWGAVLWLSGAAAGVYAIGEVVGDVDLDGEPRAGRLTTSRSCLLRWSDIRPGDPITKARLLAAGAFGQARIIRQPMGGNPLRLTPEEWQAIHALR